MGCLAASWLLVGARTNLKRKPVSSSYCVEVYSFVKGSWALWADSGEKVVLVVVMEAIAEVVLVVVVVVVVVVEASRLHSKLARVFVFGLLVVWVFFEGLLW